MRILGSGITGLMLGYLTNSPVYGEIVGGQMAGMPKGPRILHWTAETEAFMKDLGLDLPPRTFIVGYNKSPGAVPGVVAAEALPSDRIEYYKKTRGGTTPPPGSVMSGGANKIVGWDLSKINLVDLLAEQVTVIPARVDSVDFDTDVIEMKLASGATQVIPVEDSICTFGLNRLSRLIKQDLHEILFLFEEDGKIYRSRDSLFDLDFSAFDTTFMKVDVSSLSLQMVPPPYDYVYCTSEKNPINRITRLDDQYCIFETRGDRYEAAVEYFEAMGLDPGFCETIRFCQLKTSYKVKELAYERSPIRPRLRLCGRFASWDHGFKIDSVFEEARSYVKQMGD